LRLAIAFVGRALGQVVGRYKAVLIELYRAVCIEYQPVIDTDGNLHLQIVVTRLTLLIVDELVTRNTGLDRFHENLGKRRVYKKNRLNIAWLPFKIRNCVYIVVSNNSRVVRTNT
jgi:hypothetical protein